MYDIDRDGYISNGELFIVMKMMVGSNLKDQQLQQVSSIFILIIFSKLLTFYQIVDKVTAIRDMINLRNNLINMNRR